MYLCIYFFKSNYSFKKCIKVSGKVKNIHVIQFSPDVDVVSTIHANSDVISMAFSKALSGGIAGNVLTTIFEALELELCCCRSEVLKSSSSQFNVAKNCYELSV